MKLLRLMYSVIRVVRRKIPYAMGFCHTCERLRVKINMHRIIVESWINGKVCRMAKSKIKRAKGEKRRKRKEAKREKRTRSIDLLLAKTTLLSLILWNLRWVLQAKGTRGEENKGPERSVHTGDQVLWGGIRSREVKLPQSGGLAAFPWITGVSAPREKYNPTRDRVNTEWDSKLRMNNELSFYSVSFVRCAYDNPAVSFHNLRLKILGKLPIFPPNFFIWNRAAVAFERSSGFMANTS